jgi:hypothetical protein
MSRLSEPFLRVFAFFERDGAYQVTGAAALFYSLNIYDTAITHYAVSVSGLKELNPFMVFLIAAGWDVFWLYSLVGVLPIVFLYFMTPGFIEKPVQRFVIRYTLTSILFVIVIMNTIGVMIQ